MKRSPLNMHHRAVEGRLSLKTCSRPVSPVWSLTPEEVIRVAVKQHKQTSPGV